MGGGQLPQAFAEFFYGRCYLAIGRAGDADEVQRQAPEEIRQPILAAFFASVD